MNPTITIPRAKYHALLAAAEQLSDITAYDRAMAALAAGEDEAIPTAFADRLIAGESSLLVFRELRGLTQAALADRAG